jgi:transposase-like protein
MDKQKTAKFSPEVRERAVRMVIGHRYDHVLQWGGDRLDCGQNRVHGADPSHWVAQAERDQGRRVGPSTDERERIKALERENRELHEANEILRKASA